MRMEIETGSSWYSLTRIQLLQIPSGQADTMKKFFFLLLTFIAWLLQKSWGRSDKQQLQLNSPNLVHRLQPISIFVASTVQGYHANFGIATDWLLLLAQWEERHPPFDVDVLGGLRKLLEGEVPVRVVVRLMEHPVCYPRQLVFAVCQRKFGNNMQHGK